MIYAPAGSFGPSGRDEEYWHRAREACLGQLGLDQQFEDAVTEAVTYNKRSWRYIQRILEGWQTPGRVPRERSPAASSPRAGPATRPRRSWRARASRVRKYRTPPSTSWPPSLHRERTAPS